ncbi:hypothetical protein FRB90_002737, partial [Tulasnella sp. 427]
MFLSSSPQLWYLLLHKLEGRVTKSGISEPELPTGEINLPCLTTLVLRDIPSSIRDLVLSTVLAPICDWVMINDIRTQDLRRFGPRLSALMGRPLRTRPPICFSFSSSESDESVGLLRLSSDPSPRIPSEWIFHTLEKVEFEATFNINRDEVDSINEVIDWMEAMASPFELPEELVLERDTWSLWNMPIDLLLGFHSFGQTSVTTLRLMDVASVTRTAQWLNPCTIPNKWKNKGSLAETEIRFPCLHTLRLDMRIDGENVYPVLRKLLDTRAKTLIRDTAVHDESPSNESEERGWLMIEVPENSVDSAEH